jgi:hypothetical protein
MADQIPKHTVRLCEDRDAWEAFNAGSAQGNIFCSTLFLDTLGIDYDLWIAEDAAGRMLAGAVVMRKGDTVLNSPYSFSMYQGILFSGLREELPLHSRAAWTLEVLESLLASLSDSYRKLSFCLHYSCDDIRGIQWFHYHEPELGQFSIDLRYSGLVQLDGGESWEDYLSSLRKIRQREYKKAGKEGLSVELSSDIDTLEKLYLSTFERQELSVTPETFRLVRAITSAALEGGFGELLLCRNREGEPVSALLYLIDGKNAFNLIAGNLPEYRNSGSGTFTQLEAIRRCREKGLQNLDFCGMNSPSRGDFKSSFNARPVSYLVVNYQRGPA